MFISGLLGLGKDFRKVFLATLRRALGISSQSAALLCKGYTVDLLIGVRVQERCVASSKGAQGRPPHISSVRALADGGLVNVLRLRHLVDA